MKKLEINIKQYYTDKIDNHNYYKLLPPKNDSMTADINNLGEKINKPVNPADASAVPVDASAAGADGAAGAAADAAPALGDALSGAQVLQSQRSMSGSENQYQRLVNFLGGDKNGADDIINLEKGVIGIIDRYVNKHTMEKMGDKTEEKIRSVHTFLSKLIEIEEDIDKISLSPTKPDDISVDEWDVIRSREQYEVKSNVEVLDTLKKQIEMPPPAIIESMNEISGNLNPDQLLQQFLNQIRLGFRASDLIKNRIYIGLQSHLNNRQFVERNLYKLVKKDEKGGFDLFLQGAMKVKEMNGLFVKAMQDIMKNPNTADILKTLRYSDSDLYNLILNANPKNKDEDKDKDKKKLLDKMKKNNISNISDSDTLDDLKKKYKKWLKDKCSNLGISTECDPLDKIEDIEKKIKEKDSSALKSGGGSVSKSKQFKSKHNKKYKFNKMTHKYNMAGYNSKKTKKF
jgi:hypothetical protein